MVWNRSHRWHFVLIFITVHSPPRMAVWNNVCEEPYMYCICAMYDVVCEDTIWKKYSTTSRILCNKFPSLNILLHIVLQTCNANSRTKPCTSQPNYDNPQSVYLCPTPPTPIPAATNLVSICTLTPRLFQEPEFPGSIPSPAIYFLSFLLPLIQAGQLSVSGESMYTAKEV